MSDWQPIETAPKDGTVVDLWVLRNWGDKAEGYRLPDAVWDVESDSYRLFQTDSPAIGWMRKIEDGDFSGELCPIEDDGTTVTHWMPLPAPPK